MKSTLLASLTLLATAALPGQVQAPIPYVSTFGAWTFCTNGTAEALNMDCSWYTPGAETYSLNIPGQQNAVIGYHYTLTATLPDGSQKVLSGAAMKNVVNGYTVVPHLVFGGIVKAVVVEVEDMYAGARTRTQSAPVIMTRALRR